MAERGGRSQVDTGWQRNRNLAMAPEQGRGGWHLDYIPGAISANRE